MSAVRGREMVQPKRSSGCKSPVDDESNLN